MKKYAVIFTSILSSETSGYEDKVLEIEASLKEQPGYLGMDHARSEVGITVCYWESLEAIKKWKSNSVHEAAQERGKSSWYESYDVKVCEVLYEYGNKKP
jgi:heme-degrading monooxygenase HmoA